MTARKDNQKIWEDYADKYAGFVIEMIICGQLGVFGMATQPILLEMYAVALFLADRIGFYDIYRLVSAAVASCIFIAEPTLEQILETDCLARQFIRNHYLV